MISDRASVEVLGGVEALAPVEDEWRQLAERRGNAFVTPEWYLAWHRHYGQRSRPAVSVVRGEGGRLQGLLPLVREASGRPRRTRFGGANLGDRFHPVAAAGDEEEVAAAAAAAAGGWSMLVLDNVDVGATWTGALVAGAGTRLTARSYRRTVLPYVDLRCVGSWDEFLAARSRNFRSQMRRFERSLERDHELGFRRTTDPSELGADLSTFFRLHYARWEGRGGSSSAGERVRTFHEDFAAGALARGWLRLWFLELDGEPVASWYGWLLGGRYAYYLAGFDPRWSGSRVGLVLLAHTVRSAIEEGADEYDLLLGDEPYKDRFATSKREVETVLVTRAWHPSGIPAAAEAGLWHLSRRLPEGRRRRIREALGPVTARLPGARTR